MLTHEQIWMAIDTLAARQGLSASALAKLAGLDATTFNRSKRHNAEGQARWPSTESIAKVLAATGVGVDEFLSLIRKGGGAADLIPFRMADSPEPAEFDADAVPSGQNWERIPAPASSARGTFAIGISGDSGLPVYRDGDIIIASAHAEPRHGDRVVIIGKDGRTEIAVMGQSTAGQVHLLGLDGTALPPRRRGTIRAIARILWASQ